MVIRESFATIGRPGRQEPQRHSAWKVRIRHLLHTMMPLGHEFLHTDLEADAADDPERDMTLYEQLQQVGE